MAEQLGTISISFVGNYKSRDEIESNAPREYGSMARTEDADYCYDGKEWVIIRLSQYVTFKVLSRHHITGRGYVTVIHNPDLLPISSAWSAVCEGQYRLPIRGIERTCTLMTIPMVHPDWGLVTSEPTSGKFLTVRMYTGRDDE